MSKFDGKNYEKWKKEVREAVEKIGIQGSEEAKA